MKACAIFNPTARGDKARHFRKHLTELSTECSLKPTTYAGAGRELARQAVQEGYDTIIAAGGDGTVNEVVNGIADAPKGLASARLAVIPLGTVNVFARDLGLPSHLASAWRIIKQNRETSIDLGMVEHAHEGKSQRHVFVQMAGIGVDALAIELVDWEQKKKWGQIAYIIAGFKAMRSRKSELTISNGQESVTGEQILIGNGRIYGGTFRLFPKGDFRDGLLEATILARANWSTLFRGGWSLLRNRLYATKGIGYLQGRTLKVTSPSPAPFHVEAEVVGQLPITCTVQREALKVLIP